MTALRWVAFVLGLGLVAWTAESIARSLIVPRAVGSSLARVVSRSLGRVFLAMSRLFETYEAKDRVLAFQAPFTLLALLFTWIALFFAGYALILWPLLGSFGRALLESGSSIFTLGFAATAETGPTVVHFIAAGSGLVVVALLIGYLPVIYGAWNRREIAVTLLQSRAGAPAWGPELLWRYWNVGLLEALGDLYDDWERWAADVAETHTNYPVLIHFRSPHPLRSWVLGLLAVMDSAAIYLALCPSRAPVQARLCLRMGFLCLRDIAHALGVPYDPDPLPDEPIRLTQEEFEAGIERLGDIGFPTDRSPREAWPDFRGWRVNYESVAYKLADIVAAPPGPWSGPRSHLPDMEIVPQRPVNRTPDNPLAQEVAKGTGVGH